ncbi:MAG: NTPase, partial [Planctomycetales bacterium]|nr:NTPase [Planctomycetales bacterium]NIM07674.1 NTPase [Planctomycetales bacterium]NIN07179.1 NTPase [Planctomycetales bacterium]NIN76270.1 NTPase [Planctomycetales bacterium]NIP03357.1 NTPase [Planctomycetales bacterium]
VRVMDELGTDAVNRAIRSADLIVIDEIGPMEILSERFRQAVMEALESPKPLIGTLAM